MTAQQQLTLPDPAATIPTHVRPTDPHTSHAAALADPGPRNRLRAKVLAVFLDSPARMFTDDELSQALRDEYAPSIVKRRAELRQQGWIRPAGFDRVTRRGAQAQVWRLTSAGVEQGARL